jgi:membrane protein
MRLPPGQEFVGLLRVLGRFADAQRVGDDLHEDALHAAEPALGSGLLQRYLGDLDRIGLIRRTEVGSWVLACDLATTRLATVHAGLDYRLPHEIVPLPGEDRRAPAQLVARIVVALQRELDVTLAELFPPPPASPPPEVP